MIEALKTFLHYLDPVNLITLIEGEIGLAWVLPVLAFIIFAETGLMVGFFLPGDSLLFVTGLFTATGHIQENILVMLLVLIVAAIVGDQVGYITGRKIGKTLYTRPDTWYFKRKYIDKTKAFYDRHGGKTIIIGRFVPIVRTFAPIVAGVAPLEYKKFVPFNIIGGILWISSMLLAGYFLAVILGNEAGDNLGYIKYVTLGIILVSVVPIITTAIQERRLAKQQQKEERVKGNQA